MAWEKIMKADRSSAIQLNSFLVRSVKGMFLGLPKGYDGELIQWYVNKDKKIAKGVIGELTGHTIKNNHTTIPKPVKDILLEDMTILFCTKNTIYLSLYSNGQEYLEKILKEEGIKISEQIR